MNSALQIWTDNGDGLWRLAFRNQVVGKFRTLIAARRMMGAVEQDVTAMLDELSSKQAAVRAAMWADFSVGAR